MMKELITIKQASLWAKKHLNKNVTSSNISYLIQYGRFFPSPEFKIKVKTGEIIASEYALEKER